MEINRGRFNNSFCGKTIESAVFASGRDRPETLYEDAEWKLRLLGLKRIEMPKDGSCMFRAFSHILYQTQTLHYQLRKECVRYIGMNGEEFQPFIESYGFNIKDYLVQMSKPVQWGGNIEIQALSMLLKRNVHIFSFRHPEPNFVDNGFKDVSPVKLWHSHGEHFDALVTEKDYEVMTFCQEIVVSLVDLLMGKSPRSRGGYFYQNFALQEWEESKKVQEKSDEDLAKELDEYEKGGSSNNQQYSNGNNVSNEHQPFDSNRAEGKSVPAENGTRSPISEEMLHRIKVQSQLSPGSKTPSQENSAENSEDEDPYKEKKKNFLKSLKHLLPHKKKEKEKREKKEKSSILPYI